MPTRGQQARRVPGAARVFNDLQANDALLPGHASAMRRTSAILLALLVLAAVPLYWAANAAGLIGDVPTAVAKGSNSGPGGGGDDDDNSGPGSGDDDDDDRTMLKTDDTSRNGHSTRGTTNDNDTRTQLGTDDTSRNGNSTRGTTNDNDTRTNSNTHTRTRGHTQTRTRGQTQTRTRTGS